MSLRSLLSLASVATLSTLAAALNPSCAPGGNFDLSYWELQLPIGSSGHPTTISSSQLQGCNGYQNPSYFYTDSNDGSLVMKVPGDPASTGCVTTPNSQHCRTELREMDPSSGAAASWDPNAATNRLSATLTVVQADNSKYGTVIGQVHIDDSVSSKPVCELYYSQNGDLTMGVEQTRSGGNEVMTKVGNVPLNTQFSYEIRYESNVLSVSINGGAQQTLSTYQLDAPKSYFKAGNYNQGSSQSEVHFYEISVQH
ncbi:hypothetical protein VTN96DRAFT_9868 [Rasamsonia emersonii]|uniref:Alginate lyase n=1 Tax=Rasamsonia emersonii (strain ATCC 16479 / CBS 393.64 / IMI 116815) TaxID=1408163 RepID=A0A0F4YMS4_RASE3|nr:alginate lyase [Rasamsonia emersonii CBS 393.64]KKA19587.1 alginate lyase [Rasamsonia emersonii CBS 393.64]